MSSRGVPALQGEGGLSRYLSEIRKFPLLEPQEEYMFAKRWREHEDPEAARRLVTSHLRLVAKIAMGYRGYGLPLSEVAYVHVAGGVLRDGIWHDTHAHPVTGEILDILAALAGRAVPPGVLLERDDAYPSDAELAAELSSIREVLANARAG